MARCGCARRRGGDLVLLEHDVLVRRDLEALDDLGVGDLGVLDRADALVLDRRAVLLVDLAEGDGLALGRRMHLHGHRDGAEGDGPVPDRASGHEEVVPKTRNAR
jgi:hypothetical protein